jgi:uncharacterized protein (TIGR00251 family)
MCFQQPEKPIPMFLEQRNNTLLLHIKVIPNSSQTKIAGPLGNDLKIKLAAPPESGKANAALITLLAKTLQIPEKQITLLTGQTSPRKTLQIQNLSKQQALSLLTPHLPP